MQAFGLPFPVEKCNPGRYIAGFDGKRSVGLQTALQRRTRYAATKRLLTSIQQPVISRRLIAEKSVFFYAIEDGFLTSFEMTDGAAD